MQVKVKALGQRKTPVHQVVSSYRQVGLLFFLGFEVDAES